jgi:membrane protein
MGTPVRQPWRRVLPGAIAATAMWFLTTLAFGWYVTRFANYSQVYGSLGAGVALLFWLYIISLSILCGAEFNVQFNAHFHGDFLTLVRPHSTGSAPNEPSPS